MTPLDRAARDVARSLLGSHGLSLSLNRHPGGFSGAVIWHVVAPSGAFALKRLPPSISSVHLQPIHAWLRLARASGLLFIPEIVGVRDHDGACWECTRWLPGVADWAARSPAQRWPAVTALAQLHDVWSAIRDCAKPCPAIERRWQAARNWQALRADDWQPNFTTQQFSAPARRIWHCVNESVDAMMAQLAPWRERIVDVQPCWCDGRPEHVLFSGERVSGLIDFTAAKIDSVAVDLARLLDEWAETDEHWLTAVAVYRQVRPLSDATVALARTLAETGRVGAAMTWLRWLYLEHRVFPDELAVRNRLEWLSRQLLRTQTLSRRTASWE